MNTILFYYYFQLICHDDVMSTVQSWILSCYSRKNVCSQVAKIEGFWNKNWVDWFCFLVLVIFTHSFFHLMWSFFKFYFIGFDSILLFLIFNQYFMMLWCHLAIVRFLCLDYFDPCFLEFFFIMVFIFKLS